MSISDSNLLLLPGLSLPVRRSALHAAYQTTITTVLQRVKPSNARAIARLDIAIILTNPLAATAPRTALFEPVQLILEELYTLIGVAAAQHDIELDIPGGVDVRLFFLNLHSGHLDSKSAAEQMLCGPFVGGLTFVKSKRSYKSVYVPASEVGQHALDLLNSMWQEQQNPTPYIQTLPCGPLQAPSDSETNSSLSQATETHKRVIVGGTFDHLHIGHKLLLTALVFLAQPGEASDSAQVRQITVGITGDELLVNKKHASLVESWDERKQNTADFMESILVFHPDPASIRKTEYEDEPGPNGKVVRVIYGNDIIINYTRISDPFGPTITDESLTAIVISKETRSGGKAVNDERVKKGWHSLEVFEVDVLDASAGDYNADGKVEKSTFESKISSSEIRKRLEMKANSANI